MTCGQKPVSSHKEGSDEREIEPTGVGMVAPAEDAFVGACERGRCLHAAVALNAVEGVLVAAAAPAQHALGPPAQLHPAVGPCTQTFGQQVP